MKTSAISALSSVCNSSGNEASKWYLKKKVGEILEEGILRQRIHHK